MKQFAQRPESIMKKKVFLDIECTERGPDCEAKVLD